MTEEKKVFPKVEELLPEGKHVIRVKPHPVFDNDGKPVENSHRSGESKFGKWYMYDTKIEDQWVSIFANDESKSAFDDGFVEANIVPKKERNGDINYDKNGKPKLKAFYNRLSEIDLEQAKTKLKEDYVVSQEKEEDGEEGINIDDIDF